VNQQLVAKRLRSHDKTRWPEWPQANNGSDHSIVRDIHRREVTGVAPDARGWVDNVRPDASRAGRVEHNSPGEQAYCSQRLTPAQTVYFHERLLRFRSSPVESKTKIV
jgi:hypothetical protein